MKNKSKDIGRVEMMVQKDRSFASYAEHEKLPTQTCTTDMAASCQLDSSTRKKNDVLLSWLSEPEQLKNYYHLRRLLEAPSSFPSSSPDIESPQDTESIPSAWPADALTIRTRSSDICSSKIGKKNSVSDINPYTADTMSVLGARNNTQYMPKVSSKKHCKISNESDTDDEHENSALGIKPFNRCLSDELSIQIDDNANQDQYSPKLHVDFPDVTISKKRHHHEDDVVDEFGSRCKKEVNASSDGADNASEKSGRSWFSGIAFEEGSRTSHSSVSSRDTRDEVTASNAEIQELQTTMKKEENRYFMQQQAKRVKT